MSSAALLRVSHHEAGHAVVYRVLGIEVVEVWADPTAWGSLDGQAVYAGIGTLEDGTYPGPRAPIQTGLLAGRAAEETWLMMHGSSAWSASAEAASHCPTDEWWADHLGSQHGGIGFGAAQVRAQALVEQHWGRIEEVAAELVERGRLSGAEV